MTYINQSYWPVRNSYQFNLSTGENEYLAGLIVSKRKKTFIVKDPYTKLLGSSELVFVHVMCCRGNIHQVLFDHRGLERYDLYQ